MVTSHNFSPVSPLKNKLLYCWDGFCGVIGEHWWEKNIQQFSHLLIIRNKISFFVSKRTYKRLSISFTSNILEQEVKVIWQKAPHSPFPG